MRPLQQGADNVVIYVNSDYIREFANVALPYTFILVSGFSDHTMPNDYFVVDEFNRFINNPRMLHWHVANAHIVHPKISQIPIGIDYHTLTNKSWYWGPQMPPIQQEAQLIRINSVNHQRLVKCYSTFHFASYGDKFGTSRNDIVKQIPTDLVYYEPVQITREATWVNQSHYAFVISPHGNGLDCHRTWEALALGCIVIVKTSSLDCLYKDLPVLILNEWTELNQALLDLTLTEFKDKQFNLDKITLAYWKAKIRSK